MRKIFLFLFISFLVLGVDLSVKNIVRPTGIKEPGNYIPRVQIKNESSEDANASVYLKILQLPTENQIYLDSQQIIIKGNTTLSIDFISFNAIIGIYFLKCSLYCVNDTNPQNDTLSSKLRIVEISLNQWVLWDSVPLGERRKKVKEGGGMCDGSIKNDKKIFLIKGNKTNEFYLYDPIINSWTRKCSIPNYLLSAKYLPKKGSSFCRAGDFIYLAVGNNTREFLAYSLTGDSWLKKREIPLGPSFKNLKGGSSLAKGKILNKDYLFLIKGSNTREFYAYDINKDTWIERASTPYLGRETGIKKGSCLCSDGRNIYLLKGGTNEFFFYKADSNKWEIRKSMPLYSKAGIKKKVKEGAFIVYEQGQDVIFAFKGGNTTEFWAYFVKSDSWHELPPLPIAPSNKKVKGGASLLLFAGGLFALKGNNTNEVWFYKYDFPLPFMEIKEGREEVKKIERKRMTNLLIFNIAGQKVKKIKRGVYFSLVDKKIKKIIVK
ncbi:MAG: hypothetical protein N2323_01005 [candidate division WOR-3 bacterium]|nr:hypothetical protein [candidate division WOR-3 bacterium]MCX7836524.1 hypothetical protein [candidate division WOR-3 bacterium]MDW8113762.1 hypothetical protein [candidate division WOR-3 bacterium]